MMPLKIILKYKWLILGVLLILVIQYFYLDKIFSLHFVDEEDNLVLGHFLLSGQKLYSDLFSHHQPFAYIISAVFQFITTPENIQQLIQRHREFMILYSIFWSVVLIWKFRIKIIAPLLIYELTKHYLLGQLFLSESLAVYPVVYLSLVLFTNEKLKTWEYFFIGLLAGYSGMLLAPIWPFLLVYLIVIYRLKRISLKDVGLLIAGGTIPILISLPFVGINDYFYNAFFINFKYYIPQSGEEKLPWNFIKSFLSPLMVILTPFNFLSSAFVMKITSVFFIGSIIFLIKNRKFKTLLLLVTLITLANFRYFAPGQEYFRGFHLLIWYALFTILSFYLFSDFLNSLKNKKLSLALISLIIISLVLIAFSTKDLFKKSDIDRDYYINYSEQYAYGEAIKSMNDGDDRLFVIEDEWLLYFQGDVKNSHKMVNFYGWMSLVWALNDPVVEHFKNNPPEFFFCECNEDTVYAYSDQYRQMIRDGAKTNLWVLNSKFATLTEEQKNKLRFFNFQLE